MCSFCEFDEVSSKYIKKKQRRTTERTNRAVEFFTVLIMMENNDTFDNNSNGSKWFELREIRLLAYLTGQFVCPAMFVLAAQIGNSIYMYACMRNTDIIKSIKSHT